MEPDAVESRLLPLFVLGASIVAVLISIPAIIAFTTSHKATDQLQPYNPQTYPNMEDVQGKANDTKVQTDIRSLSTQLEAYYAGTGNGTYPAQANLYSSSWRTANFPGYDSQEAVSPDGAKLGESGGYSYEPSPSGCKGTTDDPCTSFVLSGSLHDGSDYTQYSLNY